VPRVPYLNAEDVPAEYREYFNSLTMVDGRIMNLHRMVAHRPELLESRTVHARSLSASTNLVSPALREIALLTVGHLTDCTYEKVHHHSRALKVGLTAEKIAALAAGDGHPIFDEDERAVIRYASEMTRDVRVSDATFSAVSALFTSAQIVELTMIIAHYNGTVRFLEALQILPDEEGGH